MDGLSAWELGEDPYQERVMGPWKLLEWCLSNERKKQKNLGSPTKLNKVIIIIAKNL